MSDDDLSEDLSSEEMELIGDFFSRTTERFQRSVTDVLTTEEVEKSPTGDFEDALLYLSDSVSDTEIQLYTFNRMKTEVVRKYEEFTPSVENVPEDAQVTPENINRLIVKRDLFFYFQLAGTLIERLSTELILEELVHEDRRSGSVRAEVEEVPQDKRRWWLYITGTIDNGTNSELSRAYGKRNALAHDFQANDLFEHFYDLGSDIERAYNAVNDLHEEVYGITIEMRLSNLLVDK